jgi:D-methionine transport system substrate-binding protein
MYRLLLLACCFLSACSKSPTLKVMASPVPHAQMLEAVKPDLQEQGITLEILVVEDYNVPNRALASREIDANFFQHLPFLEEQVKQFHYPIQSLARVEIEPMGVYSKKISALADLPEKGVIAIPNDPTNEGRALLLLEAQGVIKLGDVRQSLATPIDIAENPKQLQFIEVDAAMLPRALDDVDAAVINTNYALAIGLSPQRDALALESERSPYVNIIAVHTGDETRSDLQALAKAMTSEKMRAFILETYQGAVLPAF